MLDFVSVGPGFESHSEHFMDLFHSSPEINPSAVLVNSQLVCLPPVVPTMLCFICDICFSCLSGMPVN